MFDTILKGGDVHDGCGSEPKRTDVGIRDGKICAIENLTHAEGSEVIDVSGFAVSPGFIDLHTHSDFTLSIDGRANSQVHQGVTTEVIGQCGFSCAPARSKNDILQMAFGHCDHQPDLGWRSFDEYLTHLEAQPLGVNVLAFVGHGAIHQSVLGNAKRPGDPSEIAAMATALEKALEEGAHGFSSGLEYWPGSLSQPEHMVPLCEVATRHGVLYATHVRNRDRFYDLGTGEAIATAREASARLQISHIQPKYGAPEFAMEHCLEMIDAAKARGLDVGFDVIPHDWNHTRMMSILPQWAQEGGVSEILTRLADPDTRAQIKRNPTPMWLMVRDARWSDIVLLSSAANPDLVGLNFAEIGQMRGTDPYDAVLDILLEEAENMPALLWASQAFREADIEMCLRHPDCAVMSDTLALSTDGPFASQVGSLSGYSWAAGFLQRYVRERNVLSLPDAIRRISGLPAQRLGLSDRGTLTVGAKADICVFDPGRIFRQVDVTNPRQYVDGFQHVLVNGCFAIRAQRRLENNAGQVIRGVQKL